MHEARLRQAGNAGQGLQRKIVRNAKLFAQVLEYKTYARVDPHRTPAMKQFRSNPALDACFGRRSSQSCAPPVNLKL